MNKELLPCLFLLVEKEAGHHLYTENEDGLWRVHCSCGATGPITGTEVCAIKAWNTRPDSKIEQDCKSLCKLFSEAKLKEEFWQERCDICKEEAVIACKPYKWVTPAEYIYSEGVSKEEYAGFTAGFRAARVHKEG